MKTLIVYATHHGSSEKAAKLLKQQIGGEVILCNIRKDRNPDISEYDAVILGGSIHAGEVNQSLKKFIKLNLENLEKKHLGLFLCCMDKEKAQVQFENAYPEKLRNRSIANELFGGEFIFEKMNWFERLAIKKIAGVHETVSDIDEEAINRFAGKINMLPN